MLVVKAVLFVFVTESFTGLAAYLYQLTRWFLCIAALSSGKYRTNLYETTRFNCEDSVAVFGELVARISEMLYQILNLTFALDCK